MKYLGHVLGYLKSRLHPSDKKKYYIIKGCELISHVSTKVKYSFPFIEMVDLIKHTYIRIKWTLPLNEDVEKDYIIANIRDLEVLIDVRDVLEKHDFETDVILLYTQQYHFG